jgi:hypothetical protein
MVKRCESCGGTNASQVGSDDAREFGRASQRRARWIFVEVLLALRAAAASGRPRTGSVRSGRRSRARVNKKLRFCQGHDAFN